ncbi:MAG: trypsin-like peptidase domain-containing protein [Clostridia bacterium]|nr:trypsin-like peptidase domain-containing protein [Clostridia bacterium]
MYGYDQDRQYTQVNGIECERKSAPAKKRGKGGKFLSVLLCGLIFGAAAAGAFKGTSMLFDGNDGAQTAVSASEESSSEAREQSALANITTASYTSAASTSSRTLDVTGIAESAMPSMVAITNVSVQEVRNLFGFFGNGGTQTRESESRGTGIIIGKNESELLIVTNNHVVEDSETLTVCFVDNEACEAEIKGLDPDNDLAVIAVKLSDIKAETAAAISIAVLGDSDSLKVGQQVVAIGNALGYGQSVTTGIVSALGRSIDTAEAKMIQTDAAINPGNSGGALLNMSGEVIGINSAKFSSTEVEGMGYAISITDALPIIEELTSRTTREKVAEENASWLGVDGEDITSAVSSAYGIPQGIYLTSIDSESPLRGLGVTVKSVITHFDGVRVTSLENLENRLKYYAAGETVELTLQAAEGDGYVERTVEVTLGRASEHTASESGFGYGPFGGR